MENRELVGFGKRAVAYIIDLIIVYAITFVVSSILAMTITFSSEEALGEVVMIVSSVIFFLYFILLESSTKQATIGKSFLGIKVVDFEGKRVSVLNSAGRNFARILSGMIFAIGYLMVLFTKKKQGLHDILAKTYVVVK